MGCCYIVLIWIFKETEDKGSAEAVDWEEAEKGQLEGAEEPVACRTGSGRTGQEAVARLESMPLGRACGCRVDWRCSFVPSQ